MRSVSTIFSDKDLFESNFIVIVECIFSKDIWIERCFHFKFISLTCYFYQHPFRIKRGIINLSLNFDTSVFFKKTNVHSRNYCAFIFSSFAASSSSVPILYSIYVLSNDFSSLNYTSSSSSCHCKIDFYGVCMLIIISLFFDPLLL